MASLRNVMNSSLRNFVGRQRASRLRQPTAYKEQVPQTQREQPVPNRWVFLGCPGSGKGTFGSKLAGLLEIPHISMGDLVRQGLADGNGPAAAYGQAIKQGKLVPDDVILQLLFGRLKDELLQGKGGFVLDGFPRTVSQAEILEQVLPIEKVVNLRMREDVLISKCLGRRMCSQCGSSFNLADVDVAGADGGPRIRMAPLLPPPACLDKMVIRADDTESVVKKRLQVYYQQSQPVEEFYRSQGKLLEFQNEGSIGETWSRLLAKLNLPVNRQFFDDTQDHKSSNRCVVPGAL